MALKLPITVWKSCNKWLCRYFRSDSLVRNFQSNLIFFYWDIHIAQQLSHTYCIKFIFYRYFLLSISFTFHVNVLAKLGMSLPLFFIDMLPEFFPFLIANFPVTFEFFDGIANHDVVYSIGCISRFQLALDLVVLHFFRKHLVIGVWWNQKLFGFRCVLQILSKIFSEFQI